MLLSSLLLHHGPVAIVKMLVIGLDFCNVLVITSVHQFSYFFLLILPSFFRPF